ncbi:MAG TPA: hypothetical protein VI958_05085, partial [Acidobacteriota bacterium]
MGRQSVAELSNEADVRRFETAVLRDLTSLETMIQSCLFETGIRRIGAEQEMFLVDRSMRPASIAAQLLSKLSDLPFTAELAQFNLEMNLTPLFLQGDCLTRMHEELKQLTKKTRDAAAGFDADVLLAGILPTLCLSDLRLENLTDSPRYRELNRSLEQLRGESFLIHIKGLDELFLAHENMMLEACNTSFQIHYQTAPDHFANDYNTAQAISGPVLAAAVNSPILFQKRLWSETRLALFQHSVDERSQAQHFRDRPPRVRFGETWVQDSVLEIFKEDFVRFRLLVACSDHEDSAEALAKGEIPRLSALCLHNGTVWRWNRPCYGITNGRPHLRIECRAFPAGPSLVDEIANVAFFAGLMAAVPDEFPPISTILPFDSAKENFYAAARYGLKAHFTWFGGQALSAPELILRHLLPLSNRGLRNAGIDDRDRDYYLGIIEKRVGSGKTGAS